MIDKLTNSTMRKSTSIVGACVCLETAAGLTAFGSIGTGSSSMERTGLTARRSLHNVLSLLGSLSCIISMCLIKQVCETVICDLISILTFDCCKTGTFWYHSHLSLQYCDGLRGPLVVYDPFDPAAHLYDVDNGQRFYYSIYH